MKQQAVRLGAKVGMGVVSERKKRPLGGSGLRQEEMWGCGQLSSLDLG